MATGAGARELRVEGNDWTSTGYVEDLTRRCLALSANPAVDPSQCLMDSQLFSEAAVRHDGDLTVVEVTDRWPIIPFPYYRTEGNAVMYGLFLGHVNFLGHGKRLVLGGLWGSNVSNYYLSYRDPSVDLTNWTGRIDLRRRKEVIRAYDRGEAATGYTRDETNVSVGLGYRFTPRLEAQGGLWYRDRAYEETGEFGLDPEGYSSWLTGLDVTWDRSHYRLYFQEGTKVQIRYRREIARSDDSPCRNTVRVLVDHQAAFPLESAFKIVLQGLAVDSGDLRDAFVEGGKPGLRGVPIQGIWLRTAGTVGMDWQFPLVSLPQGTLSAGPFLDGGIIREIGEDAWGTTWSWGAAASFYLKTIAMPGLGLTVGSNRRFAGGPFVSFQLGYEF